MIDFYSFCIGFIFAVLLGVVLLYLLGFNYTYFINKYRKTHISEVHVEKIRDDQCYHRLVKFAKRHPSCMLMLMVKSWSDEEIVKERYSALKKLGNPLGLHVHLAIKPEIDELTSKEQKRIIKLGLGFLCSLNISVEDFAPGWWSYNEDTIKACRELGLKKFHTSFAENHANRKLGMEIVVVNRYIHDWEIT